MVLKLIKYALYGLRYIWFSFAYQFKSIGWPVGFETGVRVKNSSFIFIGNSVFIGRCCYLQIPDEYEIQKSEPVLSIGNKVTVGFGSMINAIQEIKIEDNVLISPQCYITDHNHEYKDPSKAIRYQGIQKPRKVIIKDGAWIGTKVTILPGVTIGKNSVIGSNSVVTKDVPDGAVAFGVPAEVVKKYDKKSKKWLDIKK